MMVAESRKRLLWLLVGLNVGVLVWYFFIAYCYGFLRDVPVSMFAASDTGTYLNVADWIAGRIDYPASLISRPFLYPLLLAGIRSVSSSPYAIWFVQFVFWIVAVNLTALSAYRLTGARTIFVLVFALMSLNLTLLGLTFYGLTEVTTFLLLAGWLYCWSGPQPKLGRDFLLVLLLSLLTVVKPVFQVPLLVFVLYLAWVKRQNYRFLGLLVAACLPVIAQLALVYALFGAVTVSNIPAYNLRHYFFAQLYAASKGSPLHNEAEYTAIQTEVRQFSDREIYMFILSHPFQSAFHYGQNMQESLFSGASSLLDYPPLYAWSEWTNRLYLGLHLAFVGLVLYVGGRRRAALFRLGFPLLISYWIFFSAGTAYWQGDRLVVTAVPFWLVAYAAFCRFSFKATATDKSP